MLPDRQIFQASSRLRWNTFKWFARLIIFILLLIIPLLWYALAKDYQPPLVGLSKINYRKNKQPFIPEYLNATEKKKYRGFEDFLKIKNQNAQSIKREKNKITANRIRAAFFVDWDPQAYFSLQSHINSLNTLMPEWFFIDPRTDTLKPSVTADALKLCKDNKLIVLPMLSNVNIDAGNGTFDATLLERTITDKNSKERLITRIIETIQKYGFQGINIDFEELTSRSRKAMIGFQSELYMRMHKLGLLVTQDVPVGNDDFDFMELSKVNDYIFLMAYDQHSLRSIPGGISDQKWIEKNLDEAARKIPSQKIVLCIGAYGYDWPDGDEADIVTYQEAISTAKQFGAPVQFDNDSYSCFYRYNDFNGVAHVVYFNDAAGNFNALRFADEYGTAGVALWRLGAEDERIWKFYHRDLSNEALIKQPFDFSTISQIDIVTGSPDYIGDGEILDVVSEPQKGIIDIENDPAENFINEENYRQLPTRYVIRRFGKVRHQVILTFDDGPNPVYTPRILDILEKEKIPAAFFVVGINAESNLPILKRIYDDGFEIGNHTFTHPNIAAVSSGRASTEMEATRLLIESFLGRSTILFRAPFNADAEPTKEEELKPIWRSKLKSYYFVGESIDPDDWQPGINADSVYDRVIRRYEADTSKGIILLHDAGGNREATVNALPRIIHYFKSRGIGFTNLSGLLNLSKDQVMPVVHDQVIKKLQWVDELIYGTGKFLFESFRIAIFLGLGKILLMSILSLLQFRRSRHLKAVPRTTINRKVSVIVPAYNEEVNAVKTLQKLLKQDYPGLEIIFVDDGSTDQTFDKVSRAFISDNRVQVFTKPNGGKASALNFGIERTDADYVVCIDADTQLMPDAIRQLMLKFEDKFVAAVAGCVKVGNQNNLLTKWQAIEYITAQNFDRRAFDFVNGITVVPGAIGAFRKTAIQQAGGFTTDTLAEDCDLTIRILRNGHIIRNCSEAVAVTEAPETLKQFMKQRFRWSYGVMQSFWKNKDACFNPKYKALGMLSLPNILLFQMILPLFAPLADLLFFFSLAWNYGNPESIHQILLFYGLFLFVDLAVSLMAFSFEKENFRKLIWILPQRFIYRQLMYIIFFRSIMKAIKGEKQGWGVLKRTGNVELRVETA